MKTLFQIFCLMCFTKQSTSKVKLLQGKVLNRSFTVKKHILHHTGLI